jgi:succinoglycan biosynthesis transport protein ExoP
MKHNSQCSLQLADRDTSSLQYIVPSNYWRYDDVEEGWPSTLKCLIKQKWNIVAFALAGALVGALISAAMPRIYDARALLEIENINSEFLNMKQVMPIDETGVSSTLSDVQTQIKVLESNLLRTKVVQRMSLHPEDISEKRVMWSSWLLHGQGDPDRVVRDEAKRAGDSMRVRELGQTRIIEVAAQSRSPKFAARFVNEICAAFIEQNLEKRWEMGQRTSSSLSKVLEDARKRLNESELALQNYAQSADLHFTSENNSVANEKLSQLQAELSRAQATRIAVQANYELAQKQISSLPDQLSYGALRDYRSKLADLMRQRAELGALYTSEHPRVRRIDAQIGSLQSAIHSEKKTVLAQLRSNFIGAVRQEQLLKERLANEENTVAEIAKRRVRYNILEQEAENNRQLYAGMLKQVEEASIATAMRSSNIRIVDPAEPPKHVLRPNLPLNCLLGLFFFGSVGMLLSLYRERSDSKVREPGQVSGALGLTELGVVPHHEQPVLRLDAEKNGKLIPSAEPEPRNGLGRLQLPFLIRDSSTETIDPTVISEFYCELMASVTSSMDAWLRTLVVTSAMPDEGKTTVLVNLGRMLASTGKRVVLVDGDLRRKTLSTLFNATDKQGLSDVLTRSANRPIHGYVQHTDVVGLDVLSCGSHKKGNPGVLDQVALRNIFRVLRQQYKYVLVDTPPILCVSDARRVARQADGVIVVVRSGYSERGAVKAACSRIQSDGIRLVGVVLNDWKPASIKPAGCKQS